jgi:hypothetical protein
MLVRSLRLQPGERVLIPRDPDYFADLIAAIEQQVRAAKAIPTVVDWTRKGSPRTGPSLRELLESADVFLWTPFRTAEFDVTPGENRDIARWTDQGGHRRQFHFHWDQGSVEADGLPGTHTPELDRLYAAALQTEPAQLVRRHAAAARMLTSGLVRVTTPAGTDIQFEVRDRPFNRQDGSASRARMSTAKVRVDREVEFPSGVLCVAPIE